MSRCRTSTGVRERTWPRAGRPAPAASPARPRPVAFPPFGGPRRFERPGQGYPPRRPPFSTEGIAPAEGEELVAGRRPVEEAFVARREARRLLVVPQRRMALEKLVLHATNLRIPVVEVEGGTLTAIAGFDGHQGIALVVAPRRWAAPDDILALAAQREQAPLVLVLDSLEDPQNVGTLLRTAESSGVHGAIFPTHHQAPLSPAAIKASAGAVEHLQLAPVDDLAGALADLHARGLRVVGADGDAPLTAREADLRGPVAIVVGSEGRGLSAAVRRRCDLLVRIPMHGRIESLNAAVAGSILLYEAAAQRELHGDRPMSSSQVLGTAGDAGDDPSRGRRVHAVDRRRRAEPTAEPPRRAGAGTRPRTPRAKAGAVPATVPSSRARGRAAEAAPSAEEPDRAAAAKPRPRSAGPCIVARRPNRPRTCCPARPPVARPLSVGRRPRSGRGSAARRPVVDVADGAGDASRGHAWRGRRGSPEDVRGSPGGLTHPASGRIIPRLAESYSCLTLRACRRSSIGRAAVL